MNPLLKLRGAFSHSKASGIPGPPELPPNEEVSSKKIKKIKSQLERILNEWSEINNDPVISVYYTRIMPKSRRPKRLFSGDKKTSDDRIVGVKFWGKDDKYHQIVYCVQKEILGHTIEELSSCIKLIDDHFSHKITEPTLRELNSKEKKKKYTSLFESYGIKRTPFSQLVVDVFFIDRIGIDRDVKRYSKDTLVSLYKTDISANKLFELLEIKHSSSKVYDQQTIMLDEKEYDILSKNAPHLIAMSCEDELTSDDLPSDIYDEHDGIENMLQIEQPSNEPTIGVIDTLFLKDSSKVYFSDWVEFKDLTSDDEPDDDTSYEHGTCVDSIIVDGPALNPDLDDGCGRFQVRHFGITRNNKVSLMRLLREIRQIVSSNRDISVWNISLGSAQPVSDNAISPLASILDDLQTEFDIVFVVAGTNEPPSLDESNNYRLGSPADSINSVVVNSVDFYNEPASYTRVGPVLGFFTKPDIAYYGGDKEDSCITWGLGRKRKKIGTSFAAPWISRKLSYLIDKKGFTREAAKALLIDAASGWNPRSDQTEARGHGIVPIRIENILSCENDEIKFVITGQTELYQTYNYKLPIPINKGKFPYTARAVLCYFPKCSRLQGVDYTNTELDFRFGRLNDGKMMSINNDLQNEMKSHIKEKDARQNFRKWDNVKIISESIKQRKIPKKMYDTSLWGIDITSKKRLDNKEREDIKFGIVVTLKEMNGQNRIDAFIKACNANQWFVEEVTPEIDLDLVVSLEEEIEFD